MSELTLRFAARSEIGRVRKNNEDAGYAATDLLVVADGMGGHEAGELASAATVAAVVAAAAPPVAAARACRFQLVGVVSLRPG